MGNIAQGTPRPCALVKNIYNFSLISEKSCVANRTNPFRSFTRKPMMRPSVEASAKVLPSNTSGVMNRTSMLTKRIIPCLDVKDGRVVKGTQFVNLRDAGDPVECGLRYSEEGADELVFLDITASSDRRQIVADMVRRVADSINIPFTVGGGLRSVDDIQEILRCGADKVSLNTAAIDDPNLVRKAAERFGSQCIVVAVDARHENDGAKVYTHGGRVRTERDAVEWAKTVASLGAGEILLTSMDSDGTKKGYDLALTRAVSDAVQIPVIASGGAGTLEHLHQGLTEGAAS